jgi:Glycosyltransferases, probably involved in cell wall biogenesis
MILSKLGVVVPFCPSDDLQDLDRSLLSLVGQEEQPYVVYLLVEDLNDELTEMIGAYSALGLRFHLTEMAGNRLERLKRGLRIFQERYLAILRPGDLLYPDAYRRLLLTLQVREAVFVFGKAQRFEVSKAPDGSTYYWGRCKKKFAIFWRCLFAEASFHSFMVDRSKLDLWRLRFSELEDEGRGLEIFLIEHSSDVKKVLVDGNLLIGEQVCTEEEIEETKEPLAPFSWQNFRSDWILCSEIRGNQKKRGSAGLFSRIRGLGSYYLYRIDEIFNTKNGSEPND